MGWFGTGRSSATKKAKSIAQDLRGKHCVVTGANSGLGYVTARELAKMGAKVTLACRSAERGERAVEKLRREALEKPVKEVHRATSSPTGSFALETLTTSRAPLCPSPPPFPVLLVIFEVGQAFVSWPAPSPGGGRRNQRRVISAAICLTATPCRSCNRKCFSLHGHHLVLSLC